MRKDKETILLAKVRRYIRDAIQWYEVDRGIPHFWTTSNYKGSKVVPHHLAMAKRFPYYVKSDKAIEEIAKKIVKEVREGESETR